ncbi:glycine cleavage system protein T [Pacificimonas flava]|uniref:aminomethyltransferase n=2 Tax=Pacificimonas TaxID=1960290 RepID=A0A219B3V0_9SPHN|nr:MULTISPECIES: glycine cleavage system aminomethyltransferase GcvT [Pacificimonas]MBZ6377218.1 glycine cleavage system aminomethyltransferase GcvT [Pacificimonas aurantium]OWV33062.1 glycine cleavage system protein T [Pacificimonas flava]
MTKTADTAKPLPLADLHRKLGAKMVPFAGYSMPLQYEGIVAEHEWVRAHAGLFDVSHMGQLEVRGPDAAKALEALMPGDFIGLKEGRLRYSLLLDDNGGVIDDLMVTRRADHFYLVVNAATKKADLAHMTRRLPDGVSIEERSDLALLALQGPAAADVITRLGGEVSTMTFMRGSPIRIKGSEIWISRSGYTGEDGFEISVPVKKAEKLAKLILDDKEVKPIGLGARDTLRLEAGLPLYGQDLSPVSTPVEAGITFAISKRRKMEGGFPGDERIRRQIEDGAKVRRVGLKLEGKQPAREGAAVYSGDAKTGVVTSGGFAPSVGAPIAMAYVAAADAKDGTELKIEVRGKKLAAKVVPMPFVQHRYVR